MSKRSGVLIISDEFDPTVDSMVAALRALDVPCYRWITAAFPLRSTVSLVIDQSLAGAQISTDSWTVSADHIRSVWHRHPGPPILPAHLTADERRFADAESRATLAGLFQTSDWFWVSRPDAIRVASSKTLQLHTARALGLRVPRTLITNDHEKALAFITDLKGNVVYKPFNSGFSASTSEFCFTTPLAGEDLEHLHLIRHSPGIFQENIVKDFELRITVIGNAVFATSIRSQECPAARADWREAEIDDLDHAPHELPDTIAQQCRQLVQEFGLAYGAIDMIVTPYGEHVFLENNPVGQFGWIEGKTGAPLTAAMARMLIEARLT